MVCSPQTLVRALRYGPKWKPYCMSYLRASSCFVSRALLFRMIVSTHQVASDQCEWLLLLSLQLPVSISNISDNIVLLCLTWLKHPLDTHMAQKVVPDEVLSNDINTLDLVFVLGHVGWGVFVTNTWNIVPFSRVIEMQEILDHQQAEEAAEAEGAGPMSNLPAPRASRK